MNFPYEVWEIILDALDQKSLSAFQSVCLKWRDLVLGYVYSGKLKSRASTLARLYPLSGCRNGLLEHKSFTFDSISFKSSHAIFLTGIGVYSPYCGDSEVAICVDARPDVESPRDLDVTTELQSDFLDDEQTAISIYFETPYEIEANEWWEVALNIKRVASSRSPIWSPTGKASSGLIMTHQNGVVFTFRDNKRQCHNPNWRTEVEYGQLPYILFWKVS